MQIIRIGGNMESLHYLLMKTHSMMQRCIVSEAQKIGLTSGQPKILDYLYDHEGSDQKTIAAYCEIEPATLVSILLRMEQKGLIERRQENGNRRSLFVYLTEKGRTAANKLHDIFASYDNMATVSMNDDETEKLKELLTNICKNLDEKEN
jgi:DNA-binding MarR family transcriptional regulator